MNRFTRVLFSILLCSLIIAVPSIWAMWIEDGVPVCMATSFQEDPQITSDGAGGSIITWADHRSGEFGSYDIYAQRIDASGTALWTTDGVLLCTDSGEDEKAPRITSDGAGGAIVVWQDYRSGTSWDVYAQRIDAAGTVLWDEYGIEVCTESLDQDQPRIISDAAGGAIIVWRDLRDVSDYDIYAQRINAAGTVLWDHNGEEVCTVPTDQLYPRITSDGTGGAIVSWVDFRNETDYDIYAQSIDSGGTIRWTTGGTVLCAAADNQSFQQIASVGTDGAIVVWQDSRGTYDDIYAQYIDDAGTVQWTTDGVPVCTAPWNQSFPKLIANGKTNSAVIAWQDDRAQYLGTSNYDIYAQYVNAAGTVQWTADGVPLCTSPENQWSPELASDGAGGAIVTWTDERSTTRYDIYAQHISFLGAVSWTTNGLSLCTAEGDKTDLQVVSDGSDGMIVTWSDSRNGVDNDIYAQSIDSNGRVGYVPPLITSISDVPGDEGGWLRITTDSSPWDNELWYSYPADDYNVWQLIDDPVLVSMIARETVDEKTIEGIIGSTPDHSVKTPNISGWPVIELGDRVFMQSKDLLPAIDLPPGTWELLGSFNACQQDTYIFRASTLVDSTGSGNPLSTYMVSIHTTIPSIWGASLPASGYSVDNLPPSLPAAVMAEQSFAPEGLSLDWDVNVENDFSYYAVYRGTDESFVPAPGNRITITTDSEHFDDEWLWDSGYYYKLSAIDIHGNESAFALLAPAEITGEETPDTPAAGYLSQNYPNPFNPQTTISFGLSEAGPVNLKIYDAAGRLVRVIIDKTLPAAHYSESWDGKDGTGRAVASGVYFYRLSTKTFSENRKMILLR